MLEESISCSPGNDRKSYRSRRFHGKAKRKSQRLDGASLANDSFMMDMPHLEALYEEPNNSIHPTTSQYENFNPFENEKLLAAADMTRASTSGLKMKNFTTSQGFVKLEELPLTGDIEEDYFTQNESCAVPIALGPETQFGITESEFVRFCDEAEVDLESQPATETKTPPAAKSIVDAILEDFCGSPYSESPPKFQSEDATPIFRFKSKSLRTYSRIRKPRRNIVTELANVHLPDDDGNASDSSGLSVQEDFSQNVVPQLDTVDLNNSIKVCENLLNLSSYFSQTTSSGKSPPVSGEKKRIPLSAVLEHIMEIRRRTFPISQWKSEEEFHGFCNDGDSETKEDTLKELLEDEDDVLQQINCDSLCYEQVEPKVSFANNCSDMEAAFEDVDAVIEEANRFLSSISYLHKKEHTSQSHSKCDKHEDVSKNSSSNSLSEDEELFEDIDLWNDNEYLLNYKTQKSNQGNPVNDRRDFSPIDGASENAGQLINEIARKEREEDSNPLNDGRGFSRIDGASENARLLINEFERKEREEDSIPLNDGRDLSPIDGASENAGLLINVFERKEREKDSNRPMNRLNGIRGYSGENKIVTASSNSNLKEVRTVENALSSSVDRMNEMRAFSEKSREKRFAFPDRINLGEVQPGNPSSSSGFLGFSTASRKPIAISDEAKRKAGDILKKFEQEETERRIEGSVDVPMIQETTTEQETDVSASVRMIQEAATEQGMEDSASIGMDQQAMTERRMKASIDAPMIGVGIPEESGRKVQREDEVCFTRQSREGLSSTLKKPESVFLGFSTASSKPISISEEAKQKAQALLEKFEKEEQEEEKKNDDRAIHEIKEQSVVASPSVSAFAGFSTASKKPIAISNEARRKADNILKEFEQAEREERLHEASGEVIEEAIGFEFFEEAFEEEMDAGEEHRKENNDLTPCKKQLPSGSIFDESKNESKKSFGIPEDVRRRADQLQRKQAPSLSIFDESKNESKKSFGISEDVRRRADQLQRKVKHNDLPQASPGPIFEGFKTASKKSIQISEDAKRRADQLLKEVKDDDLPQDFLECIEADLNDVQGNQTNSACRPLDRGEQVDGASNALEGCVKTISNGEVHAKSFNGLNGLNSSSKKSETFFEKKDQNEMNEEDPLKLGGALNHEMNKENPLKLSGALNQAKPSFPRSLEKRKELEKEAPSSSQEYEPNENNNSLKRKRTTFLTQDLDQTPVISSPRRLSFSERSPLNRIENAILHKTSSMPLIKGKSSFISRKNLLSLSKRKKCNSPGKVVEASTGPKTPEKVLQSPCPQPSATPNLKEFFDSVSTSTPRLIRNGQAKADVQPSKDSSIDNDFRHINWEDASSSGRVCRNSSVVDLNMTCSQVSPSPKQRIERLKMYGEPPPISPILMVNKCRPSGLRRTRNSMKS